MNLLLTAWRRLRAIVRENPDASFTIFAIALTIVSVATMPGGEDGYKEPTGLATALVVIQTGSIAFLRRWPLSVLTIVCVAVTTEAGLGYELGNSTFLGTLVVVFFAGSRTAGLRAAYGMGLLAAVLFTLYFIDGGGLAILDDLFVNLAIFFGAWLGGMLLRFRMARLAQIESYAAELSVRSELAAQEAVADERARIARELHDAVGHTLNLIVVQAGAAKRVRDRNPAAAFDALDSIENTGRAALADMDRMLGILREPDEAAREGSLGPRPGMDRLDAMLNEARGAGLPIDVVVTGEERRLPVSVDLTAYRIIQEAITNVLKHAPGAQTTVRIDYAPRALTLDVENGPPRGRPAGSNSRGGSGLPGMQERVALFGGTMKQGLVDGGGFRVQVSLPVGEGS